MASGSAFCTAGLSKNSTNAFAPSASAAPVRTPAYSICRKQVSSSALVVEVVLPLGTVKAGEESYETDFTQGGGHGKDPIVMVASLATSFSPQANQPSPYLPIVPSRKARP